MDNVLKNDYFYEELTTLISFVLCYEYIYVYMCFFFL